MSIVPDKKGICGIGRFQQTKLSDLMAANLKNKKSRLVIPIAPETRKTRTKTLKKAIISIEKASKTIEKVIFSIEKLNISIEKDNISIEKTNISIKKLIFSIEKLNISIEKVPFFIKKGTEKQVNRELFLR